MSPASQKLVLGPPQLSTIAQLRARNTHFTNARGPPTRLGSTSGGLKMGPFSGPQNPLKFAKLFGATVQYSTSVLVKTRSGHNFFASRAQMLIFFPGPTKLTLFFQLRPLPAAVRLGSCDLEMAS